MLNSRRDPEGNEVELGRQNCLLWFPTELISGIHQPEATHREMCSGQSMSLHNVGWHHLQWIHVPTN